MYSSPKVLVSFEASVVLAQAEGASNASQCVY